MDKKRAQEYSVRVSQANRSEVIVIIYEILHEELEQSRVDFAKGDMESFEKNLKNAQKFLNELMGSLNYYYSVSYELLPLYTFVNKVIINAIIKKTDENLDRIIVILHNLQQAFEEVCKQDQSAPLMANTQKLYAGLTYGKGTLNEVSVNVNENRGFRA